MAMNMAATRIAALAIATGLLSAGCGSDNADKTNPGMQPAPATTAGKPAVDCSDLGITMEEWTLNCQGQPPQSAAAQPAAAPLQLGQAATTAGAVNPIRGPGGGTLDITPTSVVYTSGSRSTKPENGQFLTLVFTMKPAGDIAAMPTAPIDGGGWHYITPDGQALEQGHGNGFTYTANGFGRPMTVVGATVNATESWDITTTQAGGIVQYTDGAGKTYRWQVPAVDTGPHADAVKKALG
jgi:hypothetical protein